MKKIIKKFWGVALVVMMLSSLFVIPATPAAAGNYAFTSAAILPSAVTGVLAPTLGFGFLDIAQAGDVIYGTATDAGGLDYLYKSADGGTTWVPCLAVGAAAGAWTLVAVAPDDPNYVAVVDTSVVPNIVYLSINGGATFANISATLAAGTALNDIDISPLYVGYHYVLIGGANGAAAYLAKWQVALAAAWVPIATGAAVPPPTSIQAVKYTPYPDIDQAYFFIGKTGTDLSLHIYSDAFAAIDPVGFNYPRVFATGAALVCTKAQIVLDESFLLYDNEIGFVGTDVVGGAPAVTGGVWSLVGNALTKIQTLATFNSLAWDGANMMSAAVVGGVNTVYRSSTALNGALAVFLASAPFKGPGGAANPNVFWAGGAGYCVSQGQDSAVAKTDDLGKSFNGIKLVSSAVANPFNNVLDFWVKSDGSVIYALTSDTANVDLWGYAGGVWERILILDVPTYLANEIVRSAESDTDVIYIARPANNNRVLKSTDGGVTWLLRSCTQPIADLAVQSASIAYVASSGAASVVKTSNGCTSWTTVGAFTLGVGYSIKLLADNQLVAGSAAGYVGYYDGTAWTAIAAPVAAGPAVVAATGTAAGDTIFAGTPAGLGSWTIGTSVVWAALAAPLAVPAVTGLAYANGVLYAWDNTVIDSDPGAGVVLATTLYRYYMPTITLALYDAMYQGATVTFSTPNTVNALQMAQGSNILWARDSSTNPDTLQSFTEYLLQAVATLSYPIDGAIIPVNSINGVVNPFNFLWTAPAVTALPLGTMYTLSVYYDAAGLLLVGAYPATVATNQASTGVAAIAGALTAGETYYWNIQITAPVTSMASAMGTFTIQQLQAIVPEISSPENGSTIDNLTPAFSWGPIAGVTMYTFELARDPSFALMEYTEDTPSSSAALPVATQLERGKTYFWRVKALTPAEGEWSQVGIFTVAELPPTPEPTPTITPTIILPTPTINLPTPTITMPQPTVTVILPTTTEAPVEEIGTAYIWAIIVIGAVLVIAVIVLIVRTRRTV